MLTHFGNLYSSGGNKIVSLFRVRYGTVYLNHWPKGQQNKNESKPSGLIGYTLYEKFFSD